MKLLLVLLMSATLSLSAQNTPNAPATPGSATPINQITPSSAIAPADTPPKPKFIRISGGVLQGLLLHKKDPDYPQDARNAHVQGAVILQVIVDTTGHVKVTDVLSGPQLLRQASIDAASKWTYRPYVLQGETINIQSTITINFQMSE